MITRLVILFAALFPSLIAAETPRDVLTTVAFGTFDHAASLAAAERVLSRPGSGHEAKLMEAMALGYRAKLHNSRSDALVARRAFEGVVAAKPNDPEALAALGSWHISAVTAVGGLTARLALGARRDVGLAAIERSIALGGNRALFLGNAALLRAKLDGPSAEVRRLATLAAAAPAPTRIDQQMKASAAQLLAVLTRNPAGLKSVASRLLPLGRFEK